VDFPREHLDGLFVHAGGGFGVKDSEVEHDDGFGSFDTIFYQWLRDTGACHYPEAVKMGRKPTAIKRRDKGEDSLAEIGCSYNVSGWTISRLEP
jgi:hypothetical protein